MSNQNITYYQGLREHVELDGWKKYSVGSTARVSYDPRFDLYIRVRKLEIYDDKSKMSSTKNCSKTKNLLTLKGTESDCIVASNAALGEEQKYLTHDAECMFGEHECYAIGEADFRDKSMLLTQVCDVASTKPKQSLIPVRVMGACPSLDAIRSHDDGTVISYDARRYVRDNGTTDILSWHFAVIIGNSVAEFLFLRKTDASPIFVMIACGIIEAILQIALNH